MIRSTIKLRRYAESDVEAIYQAVEESKPQLIPWMSWCHPDYSRQDTFTRVASRPEAWERNEEWDFVIASTDNHILGTCGIHRIDLKNDTAELGYWVRTSMTGNGIATEATRLLSNWAFSEKGLHRIEILASVENFASQRVAEKSGGQREGILRQRIELHGRRHDCVLYSILNVCTDM